LTSASPDRQLLPLLPHVQAGDRAADDQAAARSPAGRRRRLGSSSKRGLATALHSGDPAFDALPGYFFQRLEPALGSLLDAAAATGEIRADISAGDLLRAVALLCMPVSVEGIAYSQRMVALLIDGLRNPAELQRS
jgi:hypothetical protein